MTTHVELRRGAYDDSVSLMQVSRAVARHRRASPPPRSRWPPSSTSTCSRGMGFDVPAEAGPNDLRRRDPRPTTPRLDAGLAAVDRRPRRAARPPATRAGGGRRRRAAAHHRLGRRALAAPTSRSSRCPGQHAVVEALDAIDAGLSVMVFTDNVPSSRRSRSRTPRPSAGVLVMGPDCGTARRRRRRPRLRQRRAPRPGRHRRRLRHRRPAGDGLLDAAGVGVSHCLGVGGRDLSAAVGGRSTRQALAAARRRPGHRARSSWSPSRRHAEVLADVEAYAADARHAGPLGARSGRAAPT